MVMNKENDGIKRGNDLISRQAAIEEVETRLKAAYAWFNDGVHSAKADGTISAFIECVLMLKQLPAAESEIVRCKDCKYKQQCRKSVEHTTYEPTSVTIAYKPIDFCSYGERWGK